MLQIRYVECMWNSLLSQHLCITLMLDFCLLENECCPSRFTQKCRYSIQEFFSRTTTYLRLLK